MLRRSQLMLRLVAMCLLLAGMLTAPPASVWACTCALPVRPNLAFTVSAGIFTGTVTKIVDRANSKLWDDLRGWLGYPVLQYRSPRLVTLAVMNSWRGITETPITVGTGLGGGDCGFAFNVGGQYLVYTTDNNGEASTSICTGTAEVAAAPSHLAFLQTQATITVQPARQALATWCWPAGLAMLSGLALAGGAGWLWKRRSF